MPLFSFMEPFAELEMYQELEQRTNKLQAALSFLNPTNIATAANLYRRHPTLPHSFVTASLMMPQLGDWPSVRDIATRNAVQEDRDNYDYRTVARERNLTNTRINSNPDEYQQPSNPLERLTAGVYGGFKGAVRSTITAADSFFDEFANVPVRDAVSRYQNVQELGGSDFAAGAAAGQALIQGFIPGTAFGNRQQTQGQFQSAVAQAVQQRLQGNRVNLGSGFLPGQDPQDNLTEEQYVGRFGLPIDTISRQNRESLQIGSRFGGTTSVSPGRLIYNNILEPGTRPHNVLSGLTDAAWQFGADPTAAVGKVTSTARAASKTFRASTGIIDSPTRNTIDSLTARSWLYSKDGEFVTTVLANRSNLTEIRDILPEVKDRRLLNAIRATNDPSLIRELLSGELGVKYNEIPHTGGFLHSTLSSPTFGQIAGYLPFVDQEMSRIAGFLPTVSRSFRSTRIGRLFERVPGLKLSTEDLDSAFIDVDSWMRVVGFDDVTREDNLRRFAEIPDRDGVQFRNAVKSMLTDSIARLRTAQELPDDKTDEMIQSAHDIIDVSQRATEFFIDQIGNNVWFPGIRKHDLAGEVIPTPHHLAEHSSSNIVLPDPETINRAYSRLSKYGKLKSIDKNAFRKLSSAVLSNVFKPVMLVSAAWPVKVIAEEQVRLWTAGFRNISHPLQMVAALTMGKIDPTNKLRAIDLFGNDLTSLMKQSNISADDIKGVGFNLGHNPANQLMSEYTAAMARGHHGWLGPQRDIIGLSRSTSLKRLGVDEDYFNNWTRVELSQIINDDISQHILNNSVESAKEWFWSGDGRKLRENLALSLGEPSLLTRRDVANTLVDSYNARIHIKTGGIVDVIPSRPDAGDAARRSPWDELSPSYQRRLIAKGVTPEQHQTGISPGSYTIRSPGNQDLVKMLRDKGKVTGKDRFGNDKFTSLDPNHPNYNPDIIASHLETKYKKWAPPTIKGVGREVPDPFQNQGLWRDIMDKFFNLFMSKPSNFLSRSPLFDQTYWERVNSLLPHATDEARKVIGETAKKAHKQVDISVARAPDAVDLDAWDIDQIAKSHGGHKVKDLLYDNSHPLRWTRVLEDFMPFAEAWYEVNSTWMKLLSRNPDKIRRLQQGFSAARQEGIIQVDPETGDQYFVWLGSGQLEDHFGIGQSNIRNPLTSDLSSFNIFQGAYIPGFGPAVQVPLSYLLPQSSDYDWMRELVAPFGVQQIDEPSDLLSNVIPLSFQKILKATAFFDPEKNSPQAALVADITQQLVMTGEYDGVDDQEKLLKDARRIAQKYEFTRAVASAVVPGTPRLRQQIPDKAGELVFIEAVASQYNDKKRELGEAEADDWLLETWATTIDQVLGQGSTYSLFPRPVTEQAFAFYRDHPEVYEELPLTGYYLYPDQPQDDFEYDAWLSQLQSGDRVILTPEQQQLSRQQREAREIRDEYLVEMLQSNVSPNSEYGREFMRTVDEWLRQEYNYGVENIGVPKRPDEEMFLDELRDWELKDGPITDSQIWNNVVDFMTTYDEALEMAEIAGFQTLSSQTDDYIIYLRQTLFQYGETLASEDPSFRTLWNERLKNIVLNTRDLLGVDEGNTEFTFSGISSMTQPDEPPKNSAGFYTE